MPPHTCASHRRQRPPSAARSAHRWLEQAAHLQEHHKQAKRNVIKALKKALKRSQTALYKREHARTSGAEVRLGDDERLNGGHANVGHLVCGQQIHGEGQEGAADGLVGALHELGNCIQR